MSTINLSKEEVLTSEAMQNDLNEINQIDSIEFFISTLSNEEIQSKIESYKQITQSQITQMGNLLDTVNDKVIKLSQTGTKRAYIKGNGSVTTFTMNNNNKTDEVNQLHKEHQKKLKQLERDKEVKLKKKLAQLEEQLSKEMGKLSEDHQAKVNEYYNRIEAKQKILNELNDESKYISKVNHEAIIETISQKYQGEISGYDDEINKLENTIKDSFAQWINKANNSLLQPNITPIVSNIAKKSTMSQIKEFIAKLKEENGNDNFIHLISQLSQSPIDVGDYLDSNEGRGSICDENYYKIDENDILEFEEDEKKPIKEILVNDFTIKKCK